jgi:hypothetical protein
MRNCSLLLAVLLFCNSAIVADPVAAAPGNAQERAQDSPQAAKVKTDVQKRGMGEKSRVRTTLVNGVTVKGYISKIDEASFAVTDTKTTVATTVSYAEVRRIQGPGLSTGAKIGIGVGVAAVVVGVAAAVILSKCGAYCR